MKEQSGQVDSCFVKGGFTNWPKATEKFKEQEKSQVHNEALLLRLPAKARTQSDMELMCSTCYRCFWFDNVMYNVSLLVSNDFCII